jgi:8-amino-7-oxononanoate synthase
VSLFDKCRKTQERADEIDVAGLNPYFHAIEETDHATEVTMEGRRVLMFGSNNYLGLTHHPKVQEAALAAIRDFGTGCSGSRFLNGTLQLHHRLEDRLAAFFGKEAALVFSTGFQTNLGALSTIAGKDDTIFCDRENHASIFDGCRLSFAALKKYRHNDMEDLERLLAAAPPDNGKLIVSDGVFSMLGDLVDLPRMKELADRYGARILIDDAHSIGVIGEDGRGTESHFGIEVDLITGTFSKTLASLGGYLVGPREVVDHVKYTARPMIFSAAITPANAAAALAALEVIETEPEQMERLRRNLAYMRRGFRELGYEFPDGPSAIIALVIGEDRETFLTWRRLFDEGVYANAVISPAVPPGMGLLRTSYMATHTRAQLDRCLEVFSRIGRELHLVR